VTDISSWWDLEPIRTVSDYAPGSDLWPKGYDQELEVNLAMDLELSGRIGPMAKRVVINEYLPAGQMFVTEGEVILSKLGWEKLIATLDRQQECRKAVRRIVERELGGVLAWLREAGHDV
jgi:hypothetical protein